MASSLEAFELQTDPAGQLVAMAVAPQWRRRRTWHKEEQQHHPHRTAAACPGSLPATGCCCGLDRALGAGRAGELGLR